MVPFQNVTEFKNRGNNLIHKTVNNEKHTECYKELICVLRLNTAIGFWTFYLPTRMKLALQSDRMLCYSLKS